ncbi:MAG: NAD-dependent epimerase/dehydratase family protein, partial [Planctomycetota bacterium]
GSAARLEGTLRSVEFTVGDVRDDALLDRLLAERPSAVLHLAARVGVRRVLAAPGACEAENVEGAEAIAAAVQRAAVRPRVIAASTSEVYAESRAQLSESSALRPTRARGRWRYAASKLRAEQILDAALGGEVLHLRFFNVVGPGQDASSGMVLPRFVERALEGAALEVYGSGRQVRTLAHVDAVAEDVARVTLAGPGGAREAHAHSSLSGAQGALNVGGTARTTVLGLAERVVRLAESSSEVVFRDPQKTVSARFEEVDHRVPDLGRLRALGLGARPWDLDSIVADTLARHRAPAAPPCASPAS